MITDRARWLGRERNISYTWIIELNYITFTSDLVRNKCKLINVNKEKKIESKNWMELSCLHFADHINISRNSSDFNGYPSFCKLRVGCWNEGFEDQTSSSHIILLINIDWEKKRHLFEYLKLYSLCINFLYVNYVDWSGWHANTQILLSQIALHLLFQYHSYKIWNIFWNRRFELRAASYIFIL